MGQRPHLQGQTDRVVGHRNAAQRSLKAGPEVRQVGIIASPTTSMTCASQPDRRHQTAPFRPAQESRPDCRAGHSLQTLALALASLRSGIGANLIQELQMTLDPQALLRQLFDSAIEAAHPRHVLADHLPEDRSGRAIVIGAGKAAAAMAEAIEKVWEGELSGLVVTRYEHHADCRRIEVVEAAPVPDDAGERVARRVLELVSNLEESDR